MQQTLSVQLATSLEQITQKFGEDLSSLSARLENRIAHSQENHTTMISTVQDGQLKFHQEVQASIEEIKRSLLSNGKEKPSEEEPSLQGVGASETKAQGAVLQ